MNNSASTSVELNDEVLEQANGGVLIDHNHMPMFGSEVAVQIDHNHMPVEDAVNINNEYRTVNTWAPSDVAVNINNDY